MNGDDLGKVVPVKVLIAPDKFKGSLTAAEVVAHLGHGLADGGVDFVGCPLADGGDGSVRAALSAGYTSAGLTVAGPTGTPHSTELALDGRTAVVEVANTCGLALLDGVLEPLRSSSRGLGEATRFAVDLGAERIVLALGGSASTDGGAGFLGALGVRFLDRGGRELQPSGAMLGLLHTVVLDELVDLAGIEITVASDVQNPLLGPTGAAAVYGPQKGADLPDVATLEEGLKKLVDLLAGAGFPHSAEVAGRPGAGSAGGLGFAGLLLGGHLVSGADFFLDLLHFDDHLRECDLVVTGEGCLDGQTSHGKLPARVARRSGTTPVIAVVGCNDASRSDLDAVGILDVFALTDLTSQNPASDPILSAQLLRQVGRRVAGETGRWVT
ncbi:MAG: Glycerate kinase [Pseudonocardiales bacterium]|nr:Glycerate kinase [Pseudonocardiales bacterium]